MKNRGSPCRLQSAAASYPWREERRFTTSGLPHSFSRRPVQFFQHPSPLDAPPLFPAGRQVGMHIGIGQHAAGVVPVNAVMRGMEIAANIHIQHSHIHPSAASASACSL